MNKLSHDISLSFLLLLFVALPALAIDRIGEAIAPSLWDEYLPEPAHPSFASDLGELREGRISFALKRLDLAHLSLSAPGIQIISANTDWNISEKSRRRFDYDTTALRVAEDSTGTIVKRHRDLFQVAAGLRLSNFLTLGNWDLGAGITYKNTYISNKDEKRINGTSVSWLGGSATAQLGKLSLAGSWDKEEQRYRLGWRAPNDYQWGIVAYRSFKESSSYGAEPGFQKTLRESLRFGAGTRWQFADGERVEFLLHFSMGIRFRPWRQGEDPTWLRPIVSPLGFWRAAQKFLYDWELGFDLMNDQQYGDTEWALSLARWF